MCTVITYQGREHYFGRTLDFETTYDHQVVITPRNKLLPMRKQKTLSHHYAIIGVALVREEYPLYYDAVNEKGLAMAGLYFPGNAKYKEYDKERENIAPFEVIPWILGQCENVREAKELLQKMNIVDEAFSEELPNTPLHWILSDPKGSITVEAVNEGIRVFHNPAGVLTNNPPFLYQMFQLNNYMACTNEPAENRFSEELDLREYSRGLGALGLPGDWSSMSRFVRAVFAKLHATQQEGEARCVCQMFHLLGIVEQVEGCVELEKGELEKSIYSLCYNLEQGICYYRTYENLQIQSIHLEFEDLEEAGLILYPMQKECKIPVQN